MKAFVALGSNLGDPAMELERAGQALRALSIGRKLRASPVFRTPALLPEGGPDSWKLPFLNAVVELDWAGGARELLHALKKIEGELGRVPSSRWAPRVIDLDLLALGDCALEFPELKLPHPEAVKRSFVLDPWKHLAPDFSLGGQSVLSRSRALCSRSPLWMGIINLTPDSFSDGGKLAGLPELEARLARWEQAGVQCLDLGGESTRPGAAPVSATEEWARLEPSLCFVRERYSGKIFRPLVSVDTRHAVVAERAIELGADILNDVSGLADPAFLELLRSSRCQYVLMHSLTVPADPLKVLAADGDPVRELLLWAESKLETLAKAGIPLNRVIFDPGLGFGKTAEQSLELVKRVGEFGALPVRVMMGHSRKSFLRVFGSREFSERDGFSLGVSLHLAQAGVELIRVHESALHAEAFCSFREVSA